MSRWLSANVTEDFVLLPAALTAVFSILAAGGAVLVFEIIVTCVIIISVKLIMLNLIAAFSPQLGIYFNTVSSKYLLVSIQ